jgi:hypothetical protein
MGKGSDRRSRSPYCSADEFDKRWANAFSSGLSTVECGKEECACSCETCTCNHEHSNKK